MTEEFEPRRAEPGTEFTYSVTERTKLGDDEDLPEGATLSVETSEPDADGKVETTRYAVREGVQRTLKTDDDGVVHPKTQADALLLDRYDLPVARKAIAESKAKAEPKTEAKEG